MSILSANYSTRIKIASKEYLYFGGTNYLGLAQRPELLEASAEAFRRFGFSSGASRLTSGENDLLLQLEEDLAAFAGAEAALVLPAGFMANQALVEGIDDDVDAWLICEHAHASIKAAVNQSRKKVISKDWKNAAELARLRSAIGLSAGARLAVILEPVAALDGQLVDLASLPAALEKDDLLILDEAQSFAVLGAHGIGAVEHFNVFSEMKRIVRTGTFSKAVGTYGGFILAPAQVVEKVRRNSLSFRGSTSLPPLICAATLESLRLISCKPESNLNKLKDNLRFLNQELISSGFKSCAHVDVPIFYLEYSDETACIQSSLAEHEIYFPSMSAYFPGTQNVGLRWTIQAGHSPDDLSRLLEVFRACTLPASGS